MTETHEAAIETPAVKTQGVDTRTTSPKTGVYRLAASVGIAVGVVFITGAVFAFGLLIGSQWGMGGGEDGYEGASSDTESSWYDDGYEEDWGSDEFPDEADGPDAQGGQPTQPSTAPSAPAR